MPATSYARRSAALVAILAPFAVASALAQQPVAPMPPRPPLPPEPPIGPSFYVTGSGFANRAYLGVTPRSSSGASDTLGLLVEDVETGRAADKAGIRRGSRLVSIDDINLRVEPSDLGDDAAESLPESRLRRVLSRKRAGDTVAIVVLTDGRKDTRRVVLAESPFATSMRAMTTGRRVLGIAFAQRGSIRDTAGLLIVRVSSGGAADKAGLNEGDRIVSIDGVDLRVPAVDAGNSDGVSARVSRFRRALDSARDSQPVKLDVLSDSRRRTISVVPAIERGYAFSTNGFEGMAASIRASVRRDLDRSFDHDDDGNDDRSVRRSRSDDDSRSRGTMHGRTDGATLVMGGLSLATVDRDFAQRFGQGSETGALVVRVHGNWEPLKPGDVLLTIEGRSVRDGTSLDVTINRRRDQRLEVLRNGKKETITLPAAR